MEAFCVSEKPHENGTHEVHKLNCQYLPPLKHRVPIGLFENSKEALREAQKYYVSVNECHSCCLDHDVQ